MPVLTPEYASIVRYGIFVWLLQDERAKSSVMIFIQAKPSRVESPVLVGSAVKFFKPG